MASRNKIEANAALFLSLDTFCAASGFPLGEPGKARWLKSDKGSDQRRLVKADLVDALSLGTSLKLCRFDLDGSAFFCTIGLNVIDEIEGLSVDEAGGGFLTAILTEMKPTPKAMAIEVRNIIETGAETEGYHGHDLDEIAQLFPEIRVFSAADLSELETPRLFFLLCLADASRAGSWMDAQLRLTLRLIAGLSPKAIPYRILCRSLFDSDPGAVFLALYRCLEALYSYSHTSKLMGKLNLDSGLGWSHVAQVLEEVLSWRPREEPSLGILLNNAVSNDLRASLTALGEVLPDSADLVSFATKKLYQLRNSLVHYRAFHQSFDPDKVDWNRLCEATALMVLHVYEAVEE